MIITSSKDIKSIPQLLVSDHFENTQGAGPTASFENTAIKTVVSFFLTSYCVVNELFFSFYI